MTSIIDTFMDMQDKDKFQKPNFDTKIGREFLVFYLQTKFKQIINFDKKQEKQLFLSINDNFLPKFSNRLIHYPEKRILIGITGESASGKSTICNEIKNVIERLSLPVTIINADNYFIDISDLIKAHGTFDNLRDAGHDVDAPENFRLELLKDHALQLQEGNDVNIPKYLTNGTGVSILNATPTKSNKIIVIEGMATMFDPVKDVFDIKIYIETDKKLRRKRFLERAQERNQDRENALKHWNYVENAGQKYIQPSKEETDIVLNGDCDLEYFVQTLEFINHITNNFDEEDD